MLLLGALPALLGPLLGQARGLSGADVSRRNLRTLHQRVECYAADWHGRQHEYLSDRWFDPAYYAPEDTLAYAAAQPYFDVDCEYPRNGSVIASSYVFSPAAMYHPDVLRAPSAGGFQHPMSFDEGYASPPVTAVRHAALKSWMLEHHWLRGAPGGCNPPVRCTLPVLRPECSPYFFNHGADAAPLTLFFDGSIERVRSDDVAEQDQHLLDMGMDGLGSRDTPLGPLGYFGEFSSDGTIVSHHILTTGGITGRDRLMAGVRP